jgi:hypothetical protein
VAPVIVRFTNRKARDAIYAARRKLKTHSDRIFINEDLVKSTAELFREARKLVKGKILFSAWTSGGTVFVRTTNAAGERPLKIISLEELNACANGNDH